MITAACIVVTIVGWSLLVDMFNDWSLQKHLFLWELADFESEAQPHEMTIAHGADTTVLPPADDRPFEAVFVLVLERTWEEQEALFMTNTRKDHAKPFYEYLDSSVPVESYDCATPSREEVHQNRAVLFLPHLEAYSHFAGEHAL